ncbi:hypothetical protein DU478_01755 [Thalassococcus profundi]|uniref:YjbF family lipoprotein n=1 Tax=Thalassococcus profundi TaxID=2282382 RepID=A0A369TSQ8_9RHOB|nr:YjbF family lipoprotein [Thalassococcus profundi]RDD68220.1 hypothetical protein DU478_01755 [Thalassococcus profundi]
MSLRKRAMAAALVGALPLLAACGSNTGERNPTEILSQTLQAAISGGPEVQPITTQQIATALGSTTEPIALVSLLDRTNQALVLRIESNGPYETFATSSRQSLTVRGGMITATRGLGGDLMSSEAEPLLALIQAGRGGTVPYVTRYLTGDDQTEVFRYTCSVRDAGTERVAGGVIDIQGRKLAVVCTGTGPSFENTFVIDRSGQILKATQYLGDFLGRVSIQMLRR